MKSRLLDAVIHNECRSEFPSLAYVHHNKGCELSWGLAEALCYASDISVFLVHEED